jgi:hypothetical protein
VGFQETSKSAIIRTNLRKHARVCEKKQPDEGLVFGVGVGGGAETPAKPCYMSAFGTVLTVVESYIKALSGQKKATSHSVLCSLATHRKMLLLKVTMASPERAV